MSRLRRADRQRATTYAAVAALLLLGGCGGTPATQPAPLETNATPSQSTSPSPTAPAAPELPANANGASNAAAVAFVEHYIDVLNYTAATLDTTALEELSTDDCDACNRIIERAAVIKRKGGRLEGGAWSPKETTILPAQTPRQLLLQTVIDHDAERAMEAAGQEATVRPAGRVVVSFTISTDSSPSTASSTFRVLRIANEGS